MTQVDLFEWQWKYCEIVYWIFHFLESINKPFQDSGNHPKRHVFGYPVFSIDYMTNQDFAMKLIQWMHRLVLSECYSLTGSILAAEVDHRMLLNWSEFIKHQMNEDANNNWKMFTTYLMLEIRLLCRFNSKTTGSRPKAPIGISVILLPWIIIYYVI